MTNSVERAGVGDAASGVKMVVQSVWKNTIVFLGLATALSLGAA